LIFCPYKLIGIFISRKHFTTSLNEDLRKAIKKLAIDLDLTVNDLLEEGREVVFCILERYS